MADSTPHAITPTQLRGALARLDQLETRLVESPNDEALEAERVAVVRFIAEAPSALYDDRPIDRLRAAVDRYQRALAALRAHPQDAGMEQELRMADHAIYRAQWDVIGDDETLVIGRDGNFATDLGDDRILVVGPLIPLKLKKAERKLAKQWMASRGGSTNTKKLFSEVLAAFSNGEPLPPDLFGIVGGRTLIFSAAALIAQPEDAADR